MLCCLLFRIPGSWWIGHITSAAMVTAHAWANGRARSSPTGKRFGMRCPQAAAAAAAAAAALSIGARMGQRGWRGVSLWQRICCLKRETAAKGTPERHPQKGDGPCHVAALERAVKPNTPPPPNAFSPPALSDERHDSPLRYRRQACDRNLPSASAVKSPPFPPLRPRDDHRSRASSSTVLTVVWRPLCRHGLHPC